MPFISTEEVKEKRDLLKKALPDYKLSVRRKDYCAIVVVIVSGPIPIEPVYQQVNHFHIKEYYKNEPELCKVLQTIYDIINKDNGTEVEDGDYGTVPNFYTNIHIGAWDKPYKQIVK